MQRDARRLLAKNKIKGMLLAAELAEARRVKRVKDELERVRAPCLRAPRANTASTFPRLYGTRKFSSTRVLARYDPLSSAVGVLICRVVWRIKSE